MEELKQVVIIFISLVFVLFILSFLAKSLRCKKNKTYTKDALIILLLLFASVLGIAFAIYFIKYRV